MSDYTIDNEDGKVLIKSTSSITFQVGDTKVVIDSSGVTVNGTTISLTGDSQVSVKTASMSVAEG